MPYDYYDYLRKIRSDETLKDGSDYVRQNLWCEPREVVNIKNWSETEDKIREKLFFTLLYS